MRTPTLAAFVLAFAALPAHAVQGPPIPGQDWIIPSGQTVVYDTTLGPITIKNLIVQPAARLRFIGPNFVSLTATEDIRVEGEIDLDGFDAANVVTLNTGNIPEPGANGGPAGGRGGIGSSLTTSSTPAGTPGFGSSNSVVFPIGGAGGHAGYASGPLDNRRPGGGGGGALARNQPVAPDPDDPLNAGRIARPGKSGHSSSNDAITGTSPAQGGAAGPPAFQDALSTNDFWGFRHDPLTGQLVLGELSFPLAGSGGGGGGDACPTASFPTTPWTPASDEKGAGGGGGGGLGFFICRTFSLRSTGSIHANGGNGASGESTLGLNRVGGASGGGSGGFLYIQARSFDFLNAVPGSITALGGNGGAGSPDGLYNSGGNGGPGVVQLHSRRLENGIRLPAGLTLADLASPPPYVLYPMF